MDISIIVPIYNEEENLVILNNQITTAMQELDKTYEIIYINDGSTDKTSEILDQIKNRYTEIINFDKNYGQSSALQAGIDNASGDIFVTMDSDLQNDPDDIKNLIKFINEDNDVVCGIRNKRKDDFLRTFLSKIANKIIKIMFDLEIKDSGCTLRAYKKNAAKKLKLRGEHHRYIPILLKISGVNMAQVPVCHKERLFGKSKYGFNRIFKVMIDLIFLWFLKNFRTKPIYFYEILAIIPMLLLFLTWLFLSLNPMKGELFLILDITILSILLTIAIGINLEMQTQQYYEQNKPYNITDISNN